MDQEICHPCTKRLKLTAQTESKINKTCKQKKATDLTVLFFNWFIHKFSRQTANNLAVHSLSVAVQVANEFSQNNNGVMQSDETSNRTITTSDLISWSLQIARGMEFLASKKVTHFYVKYQLQFNQTLLYSTGSARRFSGPQCPFSRGWNCQSCRFRIGQTNGGLRI